MCERVCDEREFCKDYLCALNSQEYWLRLYNWTVYIYLDFTVELAVNNTDIGSPEHLFEVINGKAPWNGFCFVLFGVSILWMILGAVSQFLLIIYSMWRQKQNLPAIIHILVVITTTISMGPVVPLYLYMALISTRRRKREKTSPEVRERH